MMLVVSIGFALRCMSWRVAVYRLSYGKENQMQPRAALPKGVITSEVDRARLPSRHCAPITTPESRTFISFSLHCSMESKKPEEGPGTQGVANTKSETKLASLSPTIKSRSRKPVQPLSKDDSAAGQRAKRRRTRYVCPEYSPIVDLLTSRSVPRTMLYWKRHT